MSTHTHTKAQTRTHARQSRLQRTCTHAHTLKQVADSLAPKHKISLIAKITADRKENRLRCSVGLCRFALTGMKIVFCLQVVCGVRVCVCARARIVLLCNLPDATRTHMSRVHLTTAATHFTVTAGRVMFMLFHFTSPQHIELFEAEVSIVFLSASEESQQGLICKIFAKANQNGYLKRFSFNVLPKL